MKTTIVYFDPNFDSDAYGVPSDLSNDEILSLFNHRVEDIRRYTVEGFCHAFNHGYVSNLGYVRVLEKGGSK